jgi:hypothetical protein
MEGINTVKMFFWTCVAVIFSGFALLFSGCAIRSREVKVIKSDTPIRVLRLQIEDGDVMTCDNNTCKVVTK